MSTVHSQCHAWQNQPRVCLAPYIRPIPTIRRLLPLERRRRVARCRYAERCCLPFLYRSVLRVPRYKWHRQMHAGLKMLPIAPFPMSNCVSGTYSESIVTFCLQRGHRRNGSISGVYCANNSVCVVTPQIDCISRRISRWNRPMQRGCRCCDVGRKQPYRPSGGYRQRRGMKRL